MTIINDRIQFVADDFAELSDSAKAALVPYCGTNPFHSLLSDIANAHVATAQRMAWSAAESAELRPLVVNFRKATDEAKAVAVAAIVELAGTLGDAEKVEALPVDIKPDLGDVVK